MVVIILWHNSILQELISNLLIIIFLCFDLPQLVLLWMVIGILKLFICLVCFKFLHLSAFIVKCLYPLELTHHTFITKNGISFTLDYKHIYTMFMTMVSSPKVMHHCHNIVNQDETQLICHNMMSTMFKATVILFIHATSMESWEINTSTTS